MAAYNKFSVYTRDVNTAKHDWSTHVYKIMLTNTAPVATNAVKSDITEITAGNGYTAGGSVTTIGISNTTGTETATASTVTITATGGSIPTFQYAVLYNDTTSSPAKPLVAWFDNGSPINLATGNSTTISFPTNLWSLV